MVEDVLYTLLSNDATVSGIVGTKIYPYLAIEEVSLPYVVFDEEEVEPTNTKDGVSGLDTVFVDVEAFASSVTELQTLRLALRDVLERYTGTVNSKLIDGITYLGEGSGFDLKDRIYMNVQKFKIRYKNGN